MQAGISCTSGAESPCHRRARLPCGCALVAPKVGTASEPVHSPCTARSAHFTTKRRSEPRAVCCWKKPAGAPDESRGNFLPPRTPRVPREAQVCRSSSSCAPTKMLWLCDSEGMGRASKSEPIGMDEMERSTLPFPCGTTSLPLGSGKCCLYVVKKWLLALNPFGGSRNWFAEVFGRLVRGSVRGLTWP